MRTLSDLVTSLYNYKEYLRFLQHRKRRVFGFGILLVTLYFLLTIVFPVVRFQINTGGLYKLLNENVPDFELSNGVLWAEDVYEYEDGKTIFIVDTTGKEIDIESLLRNYNEIFLLDAEKMVVKSEGETNIMSYDELGLEFDRAQAIEAINNFAVIGGLLLGVVIYFWMWGTFFLGVLFVTLIAMIISSAMKTGLTFGRIYMLAVYSRTLPLLIKAVVSLLPFTIPFFWVLNFGLSLIILAVVFSQIKSEQQRQQAAQQQAYQDQYGIR